MSTALPIMNCPLTHHHLIVSRDGDAMCKPRIPRTWDISQFPPPNIRRKRSRSPQTPTWGFGQLYTRFWSAAWWAGWWADFGCRSWILTARSLEGASHNHGQLAHGRLAARKNNLVLIPWRDLGPAPEQKVSWCLDWWQRLDSRKLDFFDRGLRQCRHTVLCQDVLFIGALVGGNVPLEQWVQSKYCSRNSKALDFLVQPCVERSREELTV